MTKAILISILALILSACAPEKKKNRVPELAAAVAQYAPKRADFATDLEHVSALTNFVQESSVHDSRPRPANWGYLNTELYLEVMLNYLNGTADLPYLQCGDKAALEIALLAHYGYQARLVNVYDSRDTGHMFLDWYSPAHGKWLVTDPDFNIRYEDNAGNPLSMREVIALDPFTDYAPVGNAQGTGTGWDFAVKNGSSVKVLRDGNYLAVTFNWNTLEAEVNDSRYSAAEVRTWPLMQGKTIYVH